MSPSVTIIQEFMGTQDFVDQIDELSVMLFDSWSMRSYVGDSKVSLNAIMDDDTINVTARFIDDDDETLVFDFDAESKEELCDLISDYVRENIIDVVLADHGFDSTNIGIDTAIVD